MPLSFQQGQRKNRAEEGKARTLCPSSPPMIAATLAGHDGKGSPLYGRTWKCVCVFMKNDFTWPLMMQAPFHPHFRGRENSRGGLVQCGRGSQNPLINSVMEKCLRLLRVWGDWNVAVCEQFDLMRWEAGKHATLLKKEGMFSLLSVEGKEGGGSQTSTGSGGISDSTKQLVSKQDKVGNLTGKERAHDSRRRILFSI